MRTTKALKNIAVSLLTRLGVVLLTFLVVPYVFKALGQELYGLNALLFQTVGYLGLADLGVGTAISLAFYKSLAEDNRDETNTILASASRIFLGIAFLVIIIGIGTSFFVEHLFKIEEDTYQTAQIVLIIYTLKSAVTYFFGATNTFIVANQSSYEVGVVNIIGRPGFVMGKAVAIFLGFSVIGVAMSALIVTVLMELSKFRIILKKYPWLDLNYPKRSYKDLFKTTSYVFFDRFLDMSIKNTDFILIGSILGGAFVANFAIYTTLTVILNRFVVSVLNPIASGIGEMFAKKELKKALSLFQDFLSTTFFISTFICVTLVFFMQPFIKIWVGSEALLEDEAAYLFIANFWILPSLFISEIFVRTQNLFRSKMIGSIFELLINLGLSIFLLNRIGITGVLVGTFVGYYFVKLWFVPMLLFRSVKVPLIQYFKMLAKYFLLGSVMLLVGYFLNQLILMYSQAPNSWFWLVINGTLFSIIIGGFNILLFHLVDKNFKSTRDRITKVGKLAISLVIKR